MRPNKTSREIEYSHYTGIYEDLRAHLLGLSHAIHTFYAYSAQRKQLVCTCFCTIPCAMLSMEKADVLCHLVQNICFRAQMPA